MGAHSRLHIWPQVALWGPSELSSGKLYFKTSRRGCGDFCGAYSYHQSPINVVHRLEGMVRCVVPRLCSRPLSWQMSSNPRDYHRTVGPHIRKGRTPGHVEKVLMLLIESDIVYCIFWVFSFCPLSNQSNTLNGMCCRWFTYWPRSEYFPAWVRTTSSRQSRSTFRCVSGKKLSRL